MEKLIKILDESDILPKYRNTPVESLIKYHNFGQPFKVYDRAQMVVGMCMDNRKQLRIPSNFAYILRTGGGNLRYSEFKLSYAIAIGGVKCIAVIGHNNCGMVNLMSRKNDFIDGLIKNAGWSKEQAEEHFTSFAPMFEIENEMGFLINEAKRISDKYKKVLVAPLFYKVEDNLLYFVEEC